MTVLSVILGVLLVIGGFSCMFTPLATFLYTGYYITIMLLVYGIAGILRFIRKESGIPGLLVSILAVIAGVIAIVHPGQTLVFDGMVLYTIAVWLIIQGAVSLFVSIRVRKIKKGWYWGAIMGVLGIIAGIYSFAHPMVTAVTTGVLLGLFFVESGMNMIVMGLAIGKVKDALEDR